MADQKERPWISQVKDELKDDHKKFFEWLWRERISPRIKESYENGKRDGHAEVQGKKNGGRSQSGSSKSQPAWASESVDDGD